MRKLHCVLIILILLNGTLYAESSSCGIFQKMQYSDRVSESAKNIANPYLSGAEFIYSWAELEPEEGKFQWDLIDSMIGIWAEGGKRVILSFRTVLKNGKSPTRRSATPEWVYDAGARKIEINDTNWPIYWDIKFLEKYENFIKSVAERYDGNPAIEFVIMGVGQFGTTKIAGSRGSLEDYKKNGYTEDIWAGTIKSIIEIYRKHFKKTPLALMPSPFQKYGDKSEIFIYPIIEYAAQKGIFLYNHSLTGKPDFANNLFLPMYDKLHNTTKIALGPDGPVKSGRWEEATKDYSEGKKEGRRERRGGKYQVKGHKERGSIEDVIRNAFGGMNGIPLTHISYLIFYSKDISAATKGTNIYDKTFEASIKKAYDQLILINIEKK